jgi:nitrogen-specific signal transduction histidine kinase
MKEKILLVDDEEGIRRVLGISLTDSGYQVLTAENGEEALRIFRTEQPDIVLSDIKMPGMDGIDLLKRIKRENPDTEVILITGHGDMDLAIKSLKYEATDFITKPIDDSSLEAALQKSREKIILKQKLKEYTQHLESLVHKKTEKLAQAEKQVSESQTRAFDEMPCYITVHDRNFKLAEANRLFREDFGFSEEADGFCYEVRKQAKEPCAQCPVVKTFEDEKSHDAEMMLTSKSGTQYNVLVWTAPLKDSSGEVNRVMVMSTDLSRILEMQDHLSSLGLMIGSISHSIKGLLTGLDGGVYLLDSGFAKEDTNKMGEGLEIVKHIVGRIKNMVLDILYYSKERELKKEPVDMSEFAAHLADVAETKANMHGIGFVRKFDPPPEEFEMDEEQIHAALLNILENAVDACTEDKSKKSHEIIFGVRHDKTHLIFEIQDNGIGMDEEKKEKIFTLFFSSKATKGTGIGLFVSDKIIRQHGGTISSDSEPGQGTRFMVKIPKTQD